MQHSLKLGGTNYHFKWVKVPVPPPLIERPVLWKYNQLVKHTKNIIYLLYKSNFRLSVLQSILSVILQNFYHTVIIIIKDII
jgi:hypothetical protein